MTECLCSNGDLSSTPSNLSEYFSVTSSLNILNSTEEVYHSFDEETDTKTTGNLQKYFHKKSDHHKITKQSKLEIDFEENGFMISTSNETIPEAHLNHDRSENSIWDKYLQSLQHAKSSESINSLEENCNNSSLLSTENVKEHSLIEVYENDLSVNEESLTCSVIHTNQLNTSQIEGELSDINDIVYESYVSTVNTNNNIISEENNSTQTEIDNDMVFESSDSPNQIIIIEVNDEINGETFPEKSVVIDNSMTDDMPIYNMVKQLELSQLEMSFCQENEDSMSKELDETVICVKKDDDDDNIHDTIEEMPKLEDFETKNRLIETKDESPVKRTYLCCSIKKRNKKKSDNQKSFKYHLSKHLFSLFKKSSHQDRKSNVESIHEQNIIATQEPVIKDEPQPFDYDGIPFIDADVAIDTERFISLAKQEIFSE